MPRSMLNTDSLVVNPLCRAPSPPPTPVTQSRGCLEDRVALLEDQQAELISANNELRAEMSVLMEWALALVTT